MSLVDYAKTKALNFIEGIYNQADPNINTKTGSVVRATVVLPFALTYAALFQDIDVLKNLFIGNYQSISEQDMDLMAGLYTRPSGSRSTATLRVYIENLESFVLESYPYFQSSDGIRYRPVKRSPVGISDILEEDGEFFVNISIISTTFGPGSTSGAGEINLFNNMPVDTRRVFNPNGTQGGDPRASNEEYFEYLKDVISSEKLNEIGGIKQYIRDNLPEVGEVKVVPAGDPLMIRDEIWSDDGLTPNLDRLGEPWTTHRTLGALDFDTQYGRVITADTMSEDDVGSRIAIPGDLENFRTILSVIDANTIVLSGHPLEGSSVSATIYGFASRIQVMADIYMYFPAVQVSSIVVDKRFFLTSTMEQTVPSSKIYYKISEGFSYAEIADSGKVVVAEGTTAESIYTVINKGSDLSGTFLTISETIPSISTNTPMSLYDMDEIGIGSDLTDTPVLYVLQLDQLDPLSFETVTTLDRTSPGNYNDPGWYISNTDPAEVFSAREVKTIVMDTKEGNNGFVEINETSANIKDSTSYFDGSSESNDATNIITKTADWTLSEGREILLDHEESILQDSGSGVSEIIVGTGVSRTSITVTGLNLRFMSDVGFRDDVVIELVDTIGPTLLATYEPGEVMAFGDTIELKTGTFPNAGNKVTVVVPDVVTSTTGGDIEWFDDISSGEFTLLRSGVDVTADVSSTPKIESFEVETVIVSTNGTSEIEVFIQTEGLVGIRDKDGFVDLNKWTVTAPSEEGAFDSNPVRVVYATHSDFAGFQATLDAGDQQLLCKDTLVKSFLPTLLDSTIRYKGTSTSQEVYNRFVDLIEEVSTTVEEGQRIRLDISNIVAALDDEGLTDSLDVDFEIRVTNFLDDGEFQVQYLNPSEDTKQGLAMNATTLAGADRVILKRLKTVANIPGRGKLILGGNNPDSQEVLPYEAVIDHEDGTFTFLLRGSRVTDYDHTIWETSYVVVRDYEPELEFQEGAIFVPATNRPYVRQLVVIKE